MFLFCVGFSIISPISLVSFHTIRNKTFKWNEKIAARCYQTPQNGLCLKKNLTSFKVRQHKIVQHHESFESVINSRGFGVYYMNLNVLKISTILLTSSVIWAEEWNSCGKWTNLTFSSLTFANKQAHTHTCTWDRFCLKFQFNFIIYSLVSNFNNWHRHKCCSLNCCQFLCAATFSLKLSKNTNK